MSERQLLSKYAVELLEYSKFDSPAVQFLFCIEIKTKFHF